MLLGRWCLLVWWCCAIADAANIPEPRAACAYCGAYILEGQSHRSNCPYYQQPSGGGNAGGSSRPAPAPAPRPKPKPPSMELQMTHALLQGMLQGMEQAEAQARAQAAEAERQAAIRRAAEEEARRQAALAELRRLAGVVDDQRRRRDLEGKDSLEGLSAAMGAGFDTPITGAAPTGDPMVVDLSDRRGLVIPGMDAPPKPTTKAEEDDARAAAAQRERIRRMAEEAEDAKALMQRLTDLEARLVAARARLVALKRQGNFLRREMDLAREEVEAAVASSMEHGMSLATIGLDRGMDKVKTIRSNQALWNETVRSADGVNQVLGKIRDADGDYQWLGADRDPVKDLTYLAERFELTSKHVTVGKAIVGSGVNLWREWQAAKAIAAAQPALAELEAERRREAAAQEKLIAEIHAARAALARRLGVPLSDVPLADPAPPKQRGIGSHVPHPYD